MVILELIYGRISPRCNLYTRIFSKVLFHFGPLNYNIASGFMFIAAIIDYALHGPYACLRKYKQNALNIK